MPSLDFQKCQGFTLIEVLVSMVILAIGLLGLASMQTLSLRDNQNAFFYAQASSLAYEMSDRIKANTPTTNAPWQSTSLPVAAATCTNSDACNSTTGCSSDLMAAYDYCAWNVNVQNRIGSTATAVVNASPYTANVCPNIAGANVAGTACANATGGNKLCLTICWTNVNQLGVSKPYLYQLEITP